MAFLWPIDRSIHFWKSMSFKADDAAIPEGFMPEGGSKADAFFY